MGASFKHIKVKFASDISQLYAVRSFIKQVCYQAPGDFEKLSLNMQLMINEIFCNIVKHSYHGQPEAEILIESELAREGIYLTLSDKGEVFNPTKISCPSLAGDQESGFGIFIIQQIADQIFYIPKTQETGWNHFCVFKRYFPLEDQMDFSHYTHSS